MKRYKVRVGDFTGMTVIATNLSKKEAETVASIENSLCDMYTCVDIVLYYVPFKFGR